MAVTIHTTPLQFSPSDNPLTFTFSSNQTAQPNFSYIVKTYLNNIFITEDRVFPESSTRAHYDCSPIILGLMPSPTFATALWQDAAITGEVKITVVENYGTTPIDQASATSSTIDVFKGCLSDEDWEDFNAPTDYQNLLFMTNYPRNERFEVLRGADVYLNMITDASKQLEIKLYTSGAVLLDSYTNTQTYVIAQLNLNTSNLIATAGFSSGDVASAAYYTVQIGTGELFTIYFLEDVCGNAYSLSWLNDYGAFDSFIFAHNLDEAATVTDRKYGKPFGAWNGTAFTYDSSNSGEQRVGTTVAKNGTIYTDWITETQQNWLVELYRSPQFRLYQYLLTYSSGPPPAYVYATSYRGVNVTSNQYSYKKQRWEDLINEAVTFNYSANHNGITR